MKQLLAVLLCLLLSGCAGQAPQAPADTRPAETEVSVAAGLYDPMHPIEKEYPGLVRAYPLTLRKVHGILPLGKDVLVLSGQGNTTLTVFTGDTLQQTASVTLDFDLLPEDTSLRIHENGISFYDPNQGATFLLDHRLHEVRRISVPEGLSGKPILSADGEILYYCTGWSVVGWNLRSGIRKTLKELAYEEQALTGLYRDDTILECTIRDKESVTRLLLSAEQGTEIRTLPENTVLNTGESRYFALIPSGYQNLPVFGEGEAVPRLLMPIETWDHLFYLPEDHAAVTVSLGETANRLDYYELSTGSLRSSFLLDALQTPKSIINVKGHSIYILTYDPAADCDMIYRWDVLRQAPDPANTATYTTEYHSPENPDSEALEACRVHARAIGDKYGISVLIWEDAAAVQPWDYRFEPEHLAPILGKELKLLEQRLAQYPPGVLEQTKAHFSGLTICLVRQIIGTTDDRSLSNATGIQFFQNGEAYVVITTGKYSEQALYHELYHVMETHILTESSGLDVWESLNPAGFTYDDSQPDADIYLQGQTRAFVDRYSMCYLKEDRARILENAMLSGRQEVFRSEYMQRKLSAMCSALREAYGLKKQPEALPWEQYLVNSLAPAP